MTEGPIAKQIVVFAIPLFLGNLFQQLYNTADTFAVGNLLGDDALAGVSSSGSLIFLLVGFFSGIAQLCRERLVIFRVNSRSKRAYRREIGRRH